MQTDEGELVLVQSLIFIRQKRNSPKGAGCLGLKRRKQTVMGRRANRK